MKSFPYTTEYTKFVKDFGYGNGTQFKVGDIIYPIKYEGNGGTKVRYSFYPGRTNKGNEECVFGWLGCTNGVHKCALGKYEIIGFTTRTIQCKRLDTE